MVIKILLILATAASAAVLFFTETQIKAKIENLNEDKSKLNDDLSSEKSKSTDLGQKLDKTTLERDTLSADLVSTKRVLDSEKTAKAAAEAETQKAKTAQKQAENSRDQTIAMNKEFFDIKDQLKLTPAKIRQIHKELPLAVGELSTIKAEQKILAVKYNSLAGQVEVLRNPNKRVLQPTGIEGIVVAVDPKWRFAILNIGGNHGVRQNGELTVSRDGRYIARLKVAKVEPGHSIANILSDFESGDEIEEGDKVIAPTGK